MVAHRWFSPAGGAGRQQPFLRCPLYIESDTGAMYEMLRLYSGVIALLVMAALRFVVAFALSETLQRQISGPILRLAA